MGGPTAAADEQLRAIHIYMGGIGLQQFFIVMFVGFAFGFQAKMHKQGVSKQGSRWRPLLFGIYASLTCITVRYQIMAGWHGR